MARQISSDEIASCVAAYSPFAHTWAELYHADDRCWYPVDFIVIAYGKWQANTSNTRDLRAELQATSDRLLNYYHGCVDPYRVYSSVVANRVPPIANIKCRMGEARRHALLAGVRHKMLCRIAAVSGC